MEYRTKNKLVVAGIAAFLALSSCPLKAGLGEPETSFDIVKMKLIRKLQKPNLPGRPREPEVEKRYTPESGLLVELVSRQALKHMITDSDPKLVGISNATDYENIARLPTITFRGKGHSQLMPAIDRQGELLFLNLSQDEVFLVLSCNPAYWRPVTLSPGAMKVLHLPRLPMSSTVRVRGKGEVEMSTRFHISTSNQSAAISDTLGRVDILVPQRLREEGDLLIFLYGNGQVEVEKVVAMQNPELHIDVAKGDVNMGGFSLPREKISELEIFLAEKK